MILLAVLFLCFISSYSASVKDLSDINQEALITKERTGKDDRDNTEV